MTLSKMSTNRVMALEPYTPFIQDYSYVVYSWSGALHLFIWTRQYNIFYDLYGIGWITALKLIININDTCMFVRVSVCK